MEHGATARGQRVRRGGQSRAGGGRQFAASPVDVIDSIVITEESDTDRVLAEWIAHNPDIAIYSDFEAAQAVKLFVNWSDRNGLVSLQQGDYFTFVVPDIFVYDYISDAENVPILNEAGEIVATYSIYENAAGAKEVRIAFTDYVENHSNISGVFWMLLYVGSVDATEQKELEFIVNDTLAAQGEVTVNPNVGVYTPRDHKVGFSSPAAIADGRYIFEWLVYFNMGESDVNGFHSLAGFSFEDVIPADSPHVFLTNARRQELGLSPAEYTTEIGEYTGADSAAPGSRYQVFLNQYSGAGAGSWYDYIEWHALTGGLTTAGIDGGDGLHVTNIELADKIFSAKLGTVTRPTIVRFYTIATIQMTESALGDTEVVGAFKDVFKGSYGEELNADLTLYQFEAGGSAQGITGAYGFSFTKVNEQSAAIQGAMFALYTSEDFSAGADRFVFSGSDGVVAFNSLPLGTFYFQETAAPFGYLSDGTVYKAVLGSAGFEIYYGPNFENKLSDVGNRIINGSEFEAQPVPVILPGRKHLTGRSLTDGMFHFAVKDAGGNTVATGINAEDGSIQFGSLSFDEPGVYAFTVVEVEGDNDRIIYDGAVFPVTVTVTAEAGGALSAEVSYPAGGIVFNNRYITTPASLVLQGKKYLLCHPLSDGMFRFVVKDAGGNTVATGINNADGSISFSGISFDEPGVYILTVAEVRGTADGIVYDGSVFTVTVTVTNDGEGNLSAEAVYPAGGIVFSNRYAAMPVCPCQCCQPCCQPCCSPCRKQG